MDSTASAPGTASLVAVGFSLLGRSVGVESLFIALWASLGQGLKAVFDVKIHMAWGRDGREASIECGSD